MQINLSRCIIGEEIISRKNIKMFEKFFGYGDDEKKKREASPITDDSGAVLTRNEIEEERKRREEDPNWTREQK